MTLHLLCSLKPVHSQFTLYEFLRAGHDWLGSTFLNIEFQLTGNESFFVFIKVSLNNDNFLIYMHFFGGNLPGVALKLT